MNANFLLMELNIESVKFLDIIESNSQSYIISNLSLFALLYKDNLQNVQNNIFNKTLFILNNSKIIENNVEFNITGNMLKTELEFDYKEIILQFEFQSKYNNNTDIRYVNCSVFKLNQSNYILQCKTNTSNIDTIIKGYSDLGNANLVILFNNEITKIYSEPIKFYHKFYYKIGKNGVVILAIIIPCLIIFLIILALIYYFKSKKRNEINKINKYDSESTNYGLKI